MSIESNIYTHCALTLSKCLLRLLKVTVLGIIQHAKRHQLLIKKFKYVLHLSEI